MPGQMMPQQGFQQPQQGFQQPQQQQQQPQQASSESESAARFERRLNILCYLAALLSASWVSRSSMALLALPASGRLIAPGELAGENMDIFVKGIW
eukprot:CAMPEP_0180073198 /NCGR_PEP_ID=MMETSP0985-20121206/13136_1 /TAXON_ID=483367 /ORGANISM="non described non described, Strain CCMP 2436" /LENGTH=95 /DNA_ID=CAMNT_0022004649 /DNA_START=15 /DNA_END=300 /DNA_ORIENTATION=-